jgi:hypothetical protein
MDYSNHRHVIHDTEIDPSKLYLKLYKRVVYVMIRMEIKIIVILVEWTIF